jgi:hypothetical protein
MNATDILKYGNRTFQASLNNVPPNEWETSGVCGYWSVKNIVAHLASHECVLVEVLTSFLGGGPTPYLNEFTAGAQFNDNQVDQRKGLTPEQTLAEYNDTHAKVMSLIAQVPIQTLQMVGTLPWYGPEYALDDFIVYGFYGHKREHSAQINVFTDRFK